MRYVVMCAVAAMLGGCGTITRGSTEPVVFQSIPPGASMQTSLGTGCPTTPCTLEISRRTEFTATFSMPGYRDTTIPVSTKVSGNGGASMVGNVIFGGVIGVGVDASNGTALDHVPNPVVAEMGAASRPTVRSTPRARRPRAAPAT